MAESMNVFFTSCGNDSVALLQWAIENKVPNIVACYSNTQWANKDWHERVARVKAMVEIAGGRFVEIQSQGFADLAKEKKGFPANGMAFCSYILKILPAKWWLRNKDRKKRAVCYTGVMRIESEGRKDWPLVKESSQNHGGRKLVSPLADKTLEYRNALLERAGFEVLPHRSRECNPCVNATIADLQQLPESDLIKVELLEDELGVGDRSGKHKYMFRPHRMGGACGIRQVKQRADRGGGKYSPMQDDFFGCDSGFCGI